MRYKVTGRGGENQARLRYPEFFGETGDDDRHEAARKSGSASSPTDDNASAWPEA